MAIDLEHTHWRVIRESIDEALVVALLALGHHWSHLIWIVGMRG